MNGATWTANYGDLTNWGWQMADSFCRHVIICSVSYRTT